MIFFGFQAQNENRCHCETLSVEAIQERDTSGSALSMTKKRQKAAFTLAEVLITLGIIGIVAAMTMPMIVENTKKQQTVVQLKKAYSVLSQAVELSELDNGSCEY